MRIVSAIVLALCSMWLFCQPAFAERRIALVIGNNGYERVPQLTNPVNDATAMAEMFKRAGFDIVQLKLNLKLVEMRRALREFSQQANDADIAIVYFAGHGIEIKGTNYLIPVDAVLEREYDADDEAISLDRLLAFVEPARQLRFIILDACRDNPFSQTMKRTLASRSVERGLAKVDTMSPNTLVAYAAKAGSTAADGDTKNSPFTTALVKYLPTPGLDLRIAFGYVRDDVLRATGKQQEPFIYGSLGGRDMVLVPKPPEPPADPNLAIRNDYELTLQINVVSAWDAFLQKYPVGFYSDLARAQREKLISASAGAADQARLAAEKKAAEEAKAADAQRAKLAAQLKAEQDAKAAADSARAEAERAAAEKKAAEAAKAAEAERARLAEKAKAEQDAKIAADKARAEAARLAAEKKAAEQSRLAAEKKASEESFPPKTAKPAAGPQLAAVLPEGRLGEQAQIEQQRPQSPCSATPPQAASLSLDSDTSLSLAQECGLKPKDSFKECKNCPEMVVVPPGEFLMGSSRSEIDQGLAAANEAPQHKVAVRQAFAIGRFEVTRDQYEAFVDATGYRGNGRCFTFEQNTPKERENRSFLMPGYAQEGNHPAVCVSWTDAQAYVSWLSRTTGKSYRLPSEAEFEYAARAGGTARYGLSDDPAELCRFANGVDQSAKVAGLPEDAPYMPCSDGYAFTAPVGSLAPNAFGLHDLIGNVWEWTADCFAEDYSSAPSETAARSLTGCQMRTVRGGDWFSGPASLRPAVRAKAGPDAHHDDIGFRVVRSLAN